MTSKSCRAEIRISAGGNRVAVARSIHSAMVPDVPKLQAKGERLSLSQKGSSVIFKIETDDIASLRANINSYLRLADASYRCIVGSSSQ